MRSSSHRGFLGLTAVVALLAARPLCATNFGCAGGDVVCLINTIRLTNGLGGSNVIRLGAGTYHLTSIDNVSSEGPNGLPVITANLTLLGAGTSATIIQRDPGAPPFRTIEVGRTGSLALRSLTIQGGDEAGFDGSNLRSSGGLGILNLGIASLSDVTVRGEVGQIYGGAGINNAGYLSLFRTLVELNQANDDSFGGGILNSGVMQINRSTIRNNRAKFGGGVCTGSNTASIANSSITDNDAFNGSGGGVFTSGGLTLTSSTIARNTMDSSDGGAGIYANAGTTRLINCTIADNVINEFATGGGGILSYGIVDLQNTILARNTWFHGFDNPQYSTPWDCAGSVTSLGHNIIGDTTGCTIALQASDFVGDAKLGAFTDQIRAADGSLQGNGQVPLLAGSPAIDAGDSNACSASDQLGYPRVDANLDCGQTCDIGAVEYAPVVNSWISPVLTMTQHNTKPLPGYPAGTLAVTKTYRNNVLNIAWPVFVLTSISSNAVLLNGDPPNAGGVGARLTPNVGSDSIWSPGETIGVQWVFGLKSGNFAPFTADAVGFPDYP
jgi:hypothetical protein